MSKKRFTLKNWNDYAEGDCIYYDNREEMGSLDVLDTLNNLSDENEELKKLIINKNEIQLKTLEELQKTQKELITIKNTIKDMYDNERTHLGHNVLAQLMEAIQ